MRNIDEILSIVSERKKLTKDKDLTELLGVSASTLSTWRKRGSIPYEALVRICVDEGWDFLELVAGVSHNNGSDSVHLNKSSVAIPANSVSVPVYSDITAAAGGGAVNYFEHPTHHVIIPAILLPHGKNGDYRVIYVTGDSMEPTLCSRDPILVDFEINSIIGTGIYVIRIDEELYVKRVDKLPDGSIRIMSDNPIYEPYIIKPNKGIDFDIVGKIVLNLRPL